MNNTLDKNNYKYLEENINIKHLIYLHHNIYHIQ